MRARPGEPGTYDVTWVTGPPGRGFTVGRLGSVPLSRAELEADARAFLAMQDDND